MHPLPLTLDNTYSINPSWVDSYQKNGHLLTRQLLSHQEVETFRPFIHEAAQKHNTEKRKLEERDTYGKAFLQTMNLWEVSKEVKAFTFARRLAQVAATLMGVSKVRLYHDQALYKEAGGGPTPWHQDHFYWPLDTNQTITLWMPLVDVTVDMGMLTFASGSQSDGLVANLEISDDSEKSLQEYVNEKKFPISQPAFMNAGDASWHHGWVLHSAPGNHSSRMREVMTVIYFADGARVTKPINTFQEADRLRWLGGIEPGQPANSVLNPILN